MVIFEKVISSSDVDKSHKSNLKFRVVFRFLHYIYIYKVCPTYLTINHTSAMTCTHTPTDPSYYFAGQQPWWRPASASMMTSVASLAIDVYLGFLSCYLCCSVLPLF